MSLIDLVDDFVWGRIDETEFLRKVVKANDIDSEFFMSKVKAIQVDLNAQLRKGVRKLFWRVLIFSLGRRKSFEVIGAS